MARHGKQTSSPGCGFFFIFLIVIILQAWSDLKDNSAPTRKATSQVAAVDESVRFLKDRSDDELLAIYNHGKLEGIIDQTRGRTIMHVAAALNRHEVLAELLKLGEPASPRDKKNFTPLHLAMENGNAEAVGVLLKGGADLKAATVNGFTILHHAAKYGFYNVAKAALKVGANPSASASGGFTPLHYAAREDHLKIAVLLCENGADTDARISYGWTPGDLAFSKSPEITNYLQSRGAAFDKQQLIREFSLVDGWPFCAQEEIIAIPDNNNPVFIAIDNDAPDQLAVLKSNGENMQLRSPAGTPAICLAIANSKLKAADYLLKHATDLASTDANGKNALHYAIEYKHEGLVREMFNYKPDLSAADRSGNTALHYALGNSQNALAVELINRGANIFAENNFARGMIHIASENSNSMMFEVLISNGCDVNQEDIHGNTPLHLAVKANNLPMVEALLKNGADFAVANNKGKTALDLAISPETRAVLSNRFEIEGQNPAERPKPAEVNILPQSSN